MVTLVLASGSDRRLALLRAGGVEPVVVPADVDETPRRTETPTDLVRRLALAKARAVPGEVVLGADTEVVRDGTALGKPADAEEARAMLRANAGRVLTVWSGVAVVTPSATRTRVVGSAQTRVVGSLLRFAALDDDAVEAYVATGEPFGAAGGFRIQGRGRQLVVDRTGCWTNVVGLPTCQVARLLAPHGITLQPDGCRRQMPAAS